MGQPDFHQVPLNVKLRVEGGEHALKRLVGEGEKKRKHKANGQEMPKGREEWKKEQQAKQWKPITEGFYGRLELRPSCGYTHTELQHFLWLLFWPP